MLQKLVKLDAFPKVERSYQKTTSLGGLSTLLVSLIMGYLFLTELFDYFSIKYKQEFLVDQTLQKDIAMTLDITVATNCKYLRLDVKDSSGESIRFSNHVLFDPVKFGTMNAQIFGNRESASSSTDTQSHSNVNSSNEKGAQINLHDLNACRIHGRLYVKKVSGNIHITALGHGHSGPHTPHDAMNFSHRIDKLCFGSYYPKMSNPLDNSYATLQNREMYLEIFQYFISIVPTIYQDNNSVILTNQYSVTNNRHEADMTTYGSILGSPGIFFNYQIEPISVRITEYSKPFSQFIVRLCGLIGGIFVSVDLLHRILLYLKTSASTKTTRAF